MIHRRYIVMVRNRGLLPLLVFINTATSVAAVSLVLTMSADRGRNVLMTPADGFTTRSHTDVEIACHVSGMEKDMEVQVIKTEVMMGVTGGTEERKYQPLAPWVLATSGGLHPALEDSGRYALSRETSGSLTVTIIDARPEDSGRWKCQILKVDKEFLAVDVNFMVVGPVYGICLHRLSEPVTNGTFTTGGQFEARAELPQHPARIACTIFFSNVDPTPSIWISDERGVLSRNLSGVFTISRDVNTRYEFARTADSPLVYHRGVKTLAAQGLYFHATEHRHVLHCAVILQGIAYEATVKLNLRFAPIVSCTHRRVGVTERDDDVTMTCSARARPSAEVHWKDINGQEITMPSATYNITTTEYDTMITSSLTIMGINESFYGTYTMTSSNRYGQDAASTLLGQAVSAGNSWPHSVGPLQLGVLGLVWTLYSTRDVT